MKLPRLLFLLLFLAPTIALAEKRAPKHTCRILFFNAPPGAPEKLHLFDGASTQEVELPRLNFSPVYELPTGDLTLRLLPAPPADPTKPPAGAPKATVPADMVDFYLLVSGDSTNTVAPVRIQVIDAGSEKLKTGQMLWYNITKHLVGGTVGSRKLVINPGTRVVLDPPANGVEDYPVNLVYRKPGEEQIYPLCETHWHFNPRSRSVVFIYPDGTNRGPRVKAFSDYRERPPKEP